MRPTGATWRTLGVSAACACAAVVTCSVGPAAARDDSRELAEVRAATAQFHDLDVATEAGYRPLADADGTTCIQDARGAGAMGTHHVRGDLVGDGALDPRRPEALLYDLTGSRPELLGVEYVVFVADWGADRPPPVLFGRSFSRVGAPNRYGLPPFYALHAWVWEHNPNGMTHDWNPRITC